ncbi:hypothetical protein PMIN01_07017 [Paraphaeosphaeria minitans]|uniref:Uncharacterized protein n=1 Tax=Paraphaeosphaeria minitans TaxID=565426 RepID=A0A9P6GHA4_9PLEO|nr:hypothetical protein PMIN01_07017 [Paraphaeosphaeria minitans]
MSLRATRQHARLCEADQDALSALLQQHLSASFLARECIVILRDYFDAHNLDGSEKPDLLPIATAVYDVGRCFGAALCIGEMMGRKRLILDGTTTGVWLAVQYRFMISTDEDNIKKRWQHRPRDQHYHNPRFMTVNWINYGVSYTSRPSAWRLPLPIQHTSIFLLVRIHADAAQDGRSAFAHRSQRGAGTDMADADFRNAFSVGSLPTPGNQDSVCPPGHQPPTRPNAYSYSKERIEREMSCVCFLQRTVSDDVCALGAADAARCGLVTQFPRQAVRGKCRMQAGRANNQSRVHWAAPVDGEDNLNVAFRGRGAKGANGRAGITIPSLEGQV